MNTSYRTFTVCIFILGGFSVFAQPNQGSILIHAGTVLAIPGEAAEFQKSIIVTATRLSALFPYMATRDGGGAGFGPKLSAIQI